MGLLTEADLAYMRETQAETRPTSAELFSRTDARPDGMGGRLDGGWPNLDDGTPVAVRIAQIGDNTASDDVLQNLATRYAASDLRKVVCDLTPLRPGDLLHDLDRGRWYEVVSEGKPEAWTTALIVWAATTSKRPPNG